MTFIVLWLIEEEVVESIDNYKICFLFKPRSSNRMPFNPIFQTIYFQILFFKLYALRSRLSDYMPLDLVF